MDRQWLEAQFKLHPEKKKADLARALNLEAPAVSKILAGMREVKAPEYVLMRAFFGLPSEGRRVTQSQQGAYVIKPLNTHSGMKDSGKSYQGDWIMPASLVKEKTSADVGEIVTYRVEEDAMIPDYKIGQDVLVNTASTSPSPSGVFLISDGMGTIIRQCEYIPQSNPSSIRVSARKQGYEPFVLEIKEGTIIGRIVARIDWVG